MWVLKIFVAPLLLGTALITSVSHDTLAMMPSLGSSAPSPPRG
jgi:hypothetical protein